LWLYDPEDILARILVGAERYGQNLQILSDVFPMQELYDLEPDIVLIDATDSRMFQVLKSEHGIDYALLMPLLDSGHIIGSLHLGLQDDSLELGEAEESLLAHLAAILSSCFRSAVRRQQNSQLTLLDSLTHISNTRGFDRDLAREISRARRSEKPVTVLLMEIDEFDDLYESYGERRGQFVIKKIAERLSSNLRATDLLARLGRSNFAVLVPGGGEMVGQEVAERMRKDIEGFSIDDGRGAVLQVCISSGLVTWEPQQFPAVDMVQLARQMDSVGSKALQDAKSRGGNCVAQSRLSTMVL
jgi:diguanylate cyclase (GGDEF)-like protein